MKSSEISVQEKRSEEVNEVLASMPTWMTKWGIIVVVLLLSAFLAAGYFIKLPDSIAGEVQLMTKVPPVSLVARANGEVNFLVEDKQRVANGAPLAVIENTANTDDMFFLIKYLKNIEPRLADVDLDASEFEVDKTLGLGEVQSDYLRFQKAVKMYFSFTSSDFYGKQIAELQHEIRYTNDIIAYLEKSADNHEKYLKNSSKVVDPVFGESEKVQNDMSYGDMSLEKQANDNRINIIQYKMKVSQLGTRLMELNGEEKAKRQQLRLELEDSFEMLQSQVMMWESRYILSAPFEGTVSLYKFWNDHQFVKAGEEVMTILPDHQEVLGKMIAPVMGVGKVEAGQQVIIKLYNFPHDEFGVIEGEVKSISMLPREKQYLIDIKLPDKLRTSYGKEIDFTQEMTGRADIIVKDLRLFERIFKDLLKF